ncbi:peptidoglycan-binding protein [Streptomyces sp. NPDC053427]|uniref:peptidoglycan-binding protein n=1 Tax=Streptomyces sp. NPDC053427 TaxID=3365701 RepID=UPI0037D1EEA0
MTAQTCPHCLAPARGDGRPTCLCAAVGAEGFDPLRIRPYVSLPGQDGADEEGNAGSDGSGDGPDTRTGTVSLVPEPLPTAPRPRRSGPTSRTFVSSEAGPAARDTADEPPGAGAPGGPAGRALPRKRALSAVLAVAGAAVAATAVLIAGEVLSGGERDRAAPPDHATAAPTAAFPTRGGPRPSATGAPSATPPHRSASQRPGGRPAPRETPTPDRPATPRPPAPTQASGSVGHTPGGRPSTAPTGPIVLREGSSGPEVTELQNRLRQLGGYAGPEDGRYDADVRDAVSRYQQTYAVTGDPDGVYGERTRASLEAGTDEP